MTTERWVYVLVALAGGAAACWLVRASADPGGARGGAVRRVLVSSGMLRTRWTREESARLRAFAAIVLAVALVAGTLAVIAEPPRDRILKSDVLYARGSETELVKEVGPPTRVTPLPSTDITHVSSVCLDAARVLEYEIPTEGFPGRVRRALRMQPLRIIMVCVNAPGAITGHSIVDIN